MVLITGASGFLGRHLVRKLSMSGTQVRGLYNSTIPSADLMELPGVTWQQCDLLDVFAVAAALEGIDEVYHCAAVVSFDPAKRDQLLRENVSGTANIVDASVDAGIRRMVAVSSVAALGRAAVATSLITEAADWEESTQNSAYSISKYYAEMEVWRGIAEGLDAVIVNPGIVLGEGNWDKGSARLIKVVNGEFPFYTRGANAWVDVQDVVTAMELLMSLEITGERYILSAGNYSYREVFGKMAAALGRKPPHIRVSPLLSGFVARWSMLKSKFYATEPTITPETARTAQAQCLYDNSKLLHALPGFEYRALEETISRMAGAFQRETKAEQG